LKVLEDIEVKEYLSIKSGRYVVPQDYKCAFAYQVARIFA
jgi:hypothetical protein